jgi:hypothetical protein
MCNALRGSRAAARLAEISRHFAALARGAQYQAAMSFRPVIVDIMMARPGVLPSAPPGPVARYIQRIAAQPDFPTAVRVIHTAAATLTSSQNALCVLFAGGIAAAAPDGGPPRRLDREVRSLVERAATTGKRIWLGRIAVEPVGAAAARAVLIVHRPPSGAAYSIAELATLSAFAGQLHGILPQLLRS